MICLCLFCFKPIHYIGGSTSKKTHVLAQDSFAWRSEQKTNCVQHSNKAQEWNPHPTCTFIHFTYFMIYLSKKVFTLKIMLRSGKNIFTVNKQRSRSICIFEAYETCSEVTSFFSDASTPNILRMNWKIFSTGHYQHFQCDTLFSLVYKVFY